MCKDEKELLTSSTTTGDCVFSPDGPLINDTSSLPLSHQPSRIQGNTLPRVTHIKVSTHTHKNDIVEMLALNCFMSIYCTSNDWTSQIASDMRRKFVVESRSAKPAAVQLFRSECQNCMTKLQHIWVHTWGGKCTIISYRMSKSCTNHTRLESKKMSWKFE